MNARRVVWALGFVVLAMSGFYVAVYLYRWEWVRAQFALLLFVAAEVALVGAWLGGRLSALERTGAGVRPEPDRRVLARLTEAQEQAERRSPFAWLAPRADRTEVFVPVLLGAGVLLSGLAWLLEHAASRFAGPPTDRSIAQALNGFALPPTLLADRHEDDWVLQPRCPRPPP